MNACRHKIIKEYPDINWDAPPCEIDMLLLEPFRDVCRRTIGQR